PGYYGMKGYMIIYEHLMKNTERKLKDIKFIKFIEVIIPELGIRFIIEDLGVDYDTAITIMCESVKYGNKYFFRDNNDECFWWLRDIGVLYLKRAIYSDPQNELK
ncbi:1464_t:CDS:1, partial [Gigaspora margarita]